MTMIFNSSGTYVGKIVRHDLAGRWLAFPRRWPKGEGFGWMDFTEAVEFLNQEFRSPRVNRASVA